MIRPNIVLAIARAEARLTRRLVRYWVFLVLAAGMGILAYLQYALGLHRTFSAYGATFAILNPRYIVAIYAQWYVLIFIVGLIFLGFDIRARDVRDRIVEVLDSKPYSNLELVFGRFLGIFLLCWIPAVVIVAFLGVLGKLISEPIEPYSLLDFAIFMTVPAFVFTIGLVFLISILVRFRLLSALLVLGIVVGMIFGGQLLPLYISPIINIHGGFALGYPSDIVHFGGGAWGFGQRAAFVLVGLALLILTAAFHPRLDDGSRGRRVAAGAVAGMLGLALFAGVVLDGHAVLADMDRWHAVHGERKEDPAPDLLAMTADVGIEPGRGLALKADLRFAAPSEQPLDQALFTLNPGIAVEKVTDTQGRELTFTFEDGLLEIALPATLPPGEETSLSLTAGGRPDLNFAYIDAATNPLRADSRDAALFILGFQSTLFTRGYVALLPGSRWLPVSGSEIGRGDPGVRPRDFFTLDLTVELPEGWLAAGPGKRGDGSAAPDGRVRYRFAPPAHLPEVGLVASRFESRSIDVEGIRFEALLIPSHVGNLDFFEDTVPEIRDWITQKLQDAEELGLTYPYDGFTMVEAPTALRGYGGGWRMDTTLGCPAMVLVRESSFPTARFDVRLGDPEPFRDKEGGLPRAKREWLERFFDNDFTGGNIFLAGTRNFFSYQTTARGEAGIPLNFVCESLSSRLLTDKLGYFSAHIYNRNLNAIIGAAIQRWFASGGPQGNVNAADVVVDTMTSRMEVWDHALGVSLSGLDPWEDPRRALDVLTLKGDAIARSLLDGSGRERIGRLLAVLRERHAGSSFDREDLIAAGLEVGEDLGPLLELWLDETDLPGFVLEHRDAYRLADDENGTPRYQVLLRVRNDEPVDGLLKVEYREGDPNQGSDANEKQESDPIAVPGHGEVEIGLITSRPPHGVRVTPYLSLNRESFPADLPSIDEEETSREEPFLGIREVEWTPSEEEIIAVDDLDEGFSVVDSGGRSGLRLGARATNEETDQGLPVSHIGTRAATRWTRRTDSRAWGKYRHTLALVRSGKGERRATFTANLPRSGGWELELHLPYPASTRSRSRGIGGTWNLAIEDSSGREAITFDTNAGGQGWNSLGTFELAEGEVSVELTDETDASFVVADAIRWMPARSGDTDMASR